MLDLNDFFYFVQVVDRGGFTAAGRALRMPKSTLSHRLVEQQIAKRDHLARNLAPRRVQHDQRHGHRQAGDGNALELAAADIWSREVVRKEIA